MVRTSQIRGVSVGVRVRAEQFPVLELLHSAGWCRRLGLLRRGGTPQGEGRAKNGGGGEIRGGTARAALQQNFRCRMYLDLCYVPGKEH